MNIGAYLYTINKNNSFKLDFDEIKDVNQDVEIYLSQKNYNDLLQKKTILSFYRRAVNRKIKNETMANEIVYLGHDDTSSHEIEMQRRDKIKSLRLNEIQKKIVELLVKGFDYKEIRKRLKINNAQLTNHVYRIKAQNT